MSEQSIFKSDESGALIDTAAGLRTVSHNVPLYVRLLQKFLANTLYAELLEAVRTGVVKLANEKAHALKGLTGNLGLTGLYMAVTQLEQRTKGENAVLPEPPEVEHLMSVYDATAVRIDELSKNPDLLG